MAFNEQSAGIGDSSGPDPRSEDFKGKESNADSRGVEELKTFAQETTLHGARFLVTQNLFRRLLWAMAILACFGYCSYQVYTCVGAFNRRPFNTKITTHISTDSSELVFPAVTLCNLNAINTRRFRHLLSLGTSNRSIIERKLKDMSLFTRRSKEILSKGFKERNPGLFRRPNTSDKTDEYRDFISHQMEEMILPSSSQFESCSINGIHCDANNFTSYLSSTFGKCFTFNADEGGKFLLRATLAGQNSGLKLRLNIERDSNLPNNIGPFVGFVIMIHDQKTFPNVEEFGIKIQPGLSSLCAIKRRKVRI